MTTAASAIGKGLSLKALGILAYAFLLASFAGTVWTNLRVADPSQAQLSELTLAILFEVLSWACLPLFAWLFVFEFTTAEGPQSRRRLGGWLLAAAIVAEVPYDLAVSGRAVDVGSQNPLWAFVFCYLAAVLFEYVDRRGGANAVVLKVAVALGTALWLALLQVGVRFGIVYLGLFVFAFFLVFWFLRQRENTMMLTAGVLGASMLVTPALGAVLLHYRAPALEAGPRLHWGFLWAYPVLLLLSSLV